MKIAIHHRPGSFSDGWIKYFNTHKIDFNLVNCYDSDIMDQLTGYDGLMWHWIHYDPKDILFAKQLIHALEFRGIKVYPNYFTCWHFDDKLAQKYLFESLEIPISPSYIFYNKKTALIWATGTDYPKVFKLRSGSGSLNVRLVKTKQQAVKMIKRSFRKGHRYYNPGEMIKENLFRAGRDKTFQSGLNVIKSFARILIKKPGERYLPRQVGYVYFQDFLPDNPFDLRVAIIGNRMMVVKRFVRPNDFRASGSGVLDFEPDNVDKHLIDLSFSINDKLNMQSVAMDFIYDKSGEPVLLEVSYCWPPPWLVGCPGYWSRDGKWHKKPVIVEDFIVEDYIAGLNKPR